MITKLQSIISNSVFAPVKIFPLVVFRILFGLMMFGGTLRFLLKGWVYDLYIQPLYHFPYYGFEWIKVLDATGMYIVFGLMLLTTLFIALGFFYRLSAIIFFLLFTYVELIDKTTYLNHYYFISLVAFILIFLPAHRFFSLDVSWRKMKAVEMVPAWAVNIIKLQLSIVYFFAGLAKLNYDWMFRAMPLKIWLPAQTNFPIIGFLFDKLWIAYLFSWFGIVYDLTLPFFLSIKRTRLVAYFFVIVFHVLTALLFPIGMFPYVMIVSTLIFFSNDFHLQLINKVGSIFNWNNSFNNGVIYQVKAQKILLSFFTLFLIFQLVFPFRYLAYKGDLFWSEQGYRFGWRVMLMEKAGTAFFYVKDTVANKKEEVQLSDYLTPFQQKMMATQPDMIVNFAHFIKSEYMKKGMASPRVFVESYVTLNGSGSQLFIDSTVDITKFKDDWNNKTWILPFKKQN